MTGKEVLDLVRETWGRAPSNLQKWCDLADVVHRDGYHNGRQAERERTSRGVPVQPFPVPAPQTRTPLATFGAGGATFNITVNLTLFGKRS